MQLLVLLTLRNGSYFGRLGLPTEELFVYGFIRTTRLFASHYV